MLLSLELKGCVIFHIPSGKKCPGVIPNIKDLPNSLMCLMVNNAYAFWGQMNCSEGNLWIINIQPRLAPVEAILMPTANTSRKQRTTQKKSGQRQTMAWWRVLPILPHVRIAMRVPILSKHRRLLSSCRRILPQTITPAWMRSSQVLEKCKLLTSGSRRTLTSMVKEPLYLFRKQ